MSRYMFGSGKLVSSVSEYSSSERPSEEEVTKPIIPEDHTTPAADIPEAPNNPGLRPKLIRFAEEYFGKYWLAMFVVILLLLFRKK